MSFLKNLFSVASWQANRQLNKLRTAEQRGHQIMENIKKEVELNRQAQISIRTQYNSIVDSVKKLQKEKSEVENFMLLASDRLEKLNAELTLLGESDTGSKVDEINSKILKETSNLNRLNGEAGSLEVRINELSNTEESLKRSVENATQQAESLRLQRDRAQQVVSLAQVRLKSAQAMAATNNGRLSQEVLDQIKELEDEADNITHVAKAKADVYDIENKTDLQNIKDEYARSNTISVQERLAKLKADRN